MASSSIHWPDLDLPPINLWTLPPWHVPGRTPEATRRHRADDHRHRILQQLLAARRAS